MRSPLRKRTLAFPGNSSLDPSCLTTEVVPADPSDPLLNPQGPRVRRSAQQSHFGVGQHFDFAYDAVAPTVLARRPRYHGRNEYCRTRSGYEYSNASAGVFSEFVI